MLHLKLQRPWFFHYVLFSWAWSMCCLVDPLLLEPKPEPPPARFRIQSSMQNRSTSSKPGGADQNQGLSILLFTLWWDTFIVGESGLKLLHWLCVTKDNFQQRNVSFFVSLKSESSKCVLASFSWFLKQVNLWTCLNIRCTLYTGFIAGFFLRNYFVLPEKFESPSKTRDDKWFLRRKGSDWNPH